jgi:UDP-glucose 4-epimerase
VRSAERLVAQSERGETGTETYEIASTEAMSVMEVAEIVQEAASEDQGIDVDVKIVENPRSSETMVDEFEVDISVAGKRMSWEPTEGVAESIHRLLR